MTKCLSSEAIDDVHWESKLQTGLFMIDITHSRESISLGCIKTSTVYDIKQTSKAIQCNLNFNRTVVSVFGYHTF